MVPEGIFCLSSLCPTIDGGEGGCNINYYFEPFCSLRAAAVFLCVFWLRLLSKARCEVVMSKMWANVGGKRCWWRRVPWPQFLPTLHSLSQYTQRRLTTGACGMKKETFYPQWASMHWISAGWGRETRRVALWQRKSAHSRPHNSFIMDLWSRG